MTVKGGAMRTESISVTELNCNADAWVDRLQEDQEALVLTLRSCRAGSEQAIDLASYHFRIRKRRNSRIESLACYHMATRIRGSMAEYLPYGA